MIDVGANVGDSVALMKRPSANAAILCVDADVLYLTSLLASTTAWTDVLVRCPIMLGAEVGLVAGGSTVTPGGTSRQVTDTLDEAPCTTLDHLLETTGAPFDAPALIKVDTDGYDGFVLRGALRTITKHEPVLFFEYDPSLLLDASVDDFDVIAVTPERRQVVAGVT